MMRALSIRQPYANQILRGYKKIEYRSTSTKIVGERFYIYVPQKPAAAGAMGWTVRDLSAFDKQPGDYPFGVIVGSAVIHKVTPTTKEMPYWHWHLSDVKRLKRHRQPVNMPQPVWFWPFA
ncbi:MAG: ASCH domain-containing protein [Phycisphaerales bacterium]